MPLLPSDPPQFSARMSLLMGWALRMPNLRASPDGPGFTPGRRHWESDLEPLVSQWLREYKLRSFGSVALHLAFAALGAIDLILDHKATLWDLAAGATILLEAGGRITSPAGDPLFPFDVVSYRGGAVPFLAGNPLAHAAAVRSYRALVEPVRTREW